MKNKINIEEIKLLIPDYVAGLLIDKEKRLVEEALFTAPELAEFCREVKNTFEFVRSVKFQEPAPQYWSILLPRIHQKIDEREAKAWNPFGVIWKVLVPVAAVVLIFILYRIVTTPEPEITDKSKVSITDESKKDTVSTIKKQPENLREEKIVNVTDETKRKKVHGKKFKEELVPAIKEQNLQKQVQEIEERGAPEFTIDDYASMGFEDGLMFGTGESGAYDEETENELGRLDSHQQNVFLEKLEKSSL